MRQRSRAVESRTAGEPTGATGTARSSGVPRVTVVGSLNTDISLAVPHLPGPGETVLSPAGADIGAGGKGANQAVAAARLGAAVRMVGCCGDDEFGTGLRAGLAAEGVDAGGVRVVAGAASGLALITVDAAGENAIAVAAGANGLAGPDEVAAAFAAPCEALVVSAEIPAVVLAGVLSRARQAGITCVLNLAPAPDGAAGLLAAGVDWLVVNEQEAAAVLGRPLAGPGEAPAAASALARMGAGNVVITLGAAGAVLARAPDTPGPEMAGAPDTPGADAAGAPGVPGPDLAGAPGATGAVAVPGFSVPSVDSVGAGDAFVAALAVALAAGVGPADAVRAACAAGAAATTRRGAQAALPRPADVLAATGAPWPLAGR
jgi:ribokinase